MIRLLEDCVLSKIQKFSDDGKLVAEVDFPDEDGKTVEITKTFVDESLQGQGMADRLMQEAYAEIKSRGKNARPTCEYARKWFEKNPDKKDILKV
jgi:predicted GNAT family acetyltransferase